MDHGNNDDTIYSDDDQSSDVEGVTDFMDHIHLNQSNDGGDDDFDSTTFLPHFTLEGLAEMLGKNQFRNVLVLTGAGISVAAGIPDFRTPNTGLYDNLQKYNLPRPEAVFDINFFRHDPTPFQSLAKEIWPGMTSRPTLTHYFIKLLQDKGLLLRNYTQNIDGLEVLAGVDPTHVIECHGHFRSAHCIDCKCVYDGEECKFKFLNEPNVPTCRACGGYIKPSIVFFGEGLPEVFSSSIRRDLTQCDLLLVMGTSLTVQPVASIPELVPPRCPRLLLNRELVGDFDNDGSSWRDVFVPGDCDDSVRKLCQLSGWEAQLEDLLKISMANSSSASRDACSIDESLQDTKLSDTTATGGKDINISSSITATTNASSAATSVVAVRLSTIERLTVLFGFDAQIARRAVEAIDDESDVTAACNWILDQGGEDKGGPIIPIYNCPHVPSHVKIHPEMLVIPQKCDHYEMVGIECGVGEEGIAGCGPVVSGKSDKSAAGACPSTENWICLECNVSRCSRYMNGHSLHHAKSTGHSVAVSLSDLSVWCHECEAYVAHSSINPLLKRLEELKFYSTTKTEGD